MHEIQPSTGGRGLRGWRLLRAPLIGVVLGLLLVKGLTLGRRALSTPEERRARAREHCEQARAISDEACRRLNVDPISLPKIVIAAMIREYSLALEEDPGHVEALEGRAYWRWYQGDGDRARSDYDELLRRDPGNALAWYQRGRLRCEGGDHAGAIADYSQSLSIEPHRQGSAVLGARARCRRDAGDYRGAVADLVAEGGYDRLGIADCHQALGEHAQALPHYDAYLRTRNYDDALYRRGVSRFATGDRAGALSDFTRAVQPDGWARTQAEAFLARDPSHAMSDVLREALAPKAELER